MTRRADRLIDKLTLENLNLENLKTIIDFDPATSQEWSLNDQLDAIDLLGYTASEEALAYLKMIYKSFVVIKQNIDWGNQQSFTGNETNLIQHYNYPNARGPLADALHYEIPLFKNAKHHLKRLKPAKELEHEKRALLEKSIAHATINRALDRLQQSLAVHLE
jgi:hypothetical protein